MMSRMFVLAAVVALSSAQDDNVILHECHTCGAAGEEYTNCCHEDSQFFPDASGVGGQCYSEVDSSICNLCGDCPKITYNQIDFSLANGTITGSTSGGGHTVGANIYNGMKGYANLDSSRFDNFPKFMRGLNAVIFDKSTDATWSNTLRCVRAPCDLYVMAYRCRLCDAKNMELMHTYMVKKLGFLPNSCGPTFQLTEGGHKHQFTVYHKEVLTAGPTTITPGFELDFAWTAVGSKRKPCLAYSGDEETCNGRSGCSYSFGKCETFWCSKPSCAVCPKFDDGSQNLYDTARPGY